MKPLFITFLLFEDTILGFTTLGTVYRYRPHFNDWSFVNYGPGDREGI